MDLEQDLRARWRPSDEQIAAADALLATGRYPGGVLSAQVLVGKEYGFWTEDIEVRPLDIIGFDRETVSRVLAAEVERVGREAGKSVTGSYAWHSKPGSWAVFEDICARYEEPYCNHDPVAVTAGTCECGATWDWQTRTWKGERQR
jgi:hypothetical protein